jgi:hypothetical protein
MVFLYEPPIDVGCDGTGSSTPYWVCQSAFYRSGSQSFLGRSVSRLGTSLFGAEASGQVLPYVRPFCATLSLAIMGVRYVSGTNQPGVLKAHGHKRYGPNCLHQSPITL